ncbi:MAG: hypothetical protein WDA71_10340, partial [Actinomycetota bacterium]
MRHALRAAGAAILAIGLTVGAGGLPRAARAAVLAGGEASSSVTRVASADAALPIAPARESEPVVLKGSSFPTWAAPGDIGIKAPSVEGLQCLGNDQFGDSPLTPDGACTHNQFEDPDASTQAVLSQAGAPQQGAPVGGLLGYRWSAQLGRFEQIPFQVDEMFTHHLSNNISGFAMYSETDRHDTYAFDREGFRWTESDPSDPCLAKAISEVAKDPVPGLDTDDELVFMGRDAGERAPADAYLPAGIVDAYEITVTDPYRPGQDRYAYVMKAGGAGPRPAFNAGNGYVRYLRDQDANTFLFSQSSYDNYGNAPKGPYYDPATRSCVTDSAKYQRHRTKDTAWVKTPRYEFRYDGRWLMTELHVAPQGSTNSLGGDPANWQYGPDLVDQWKARAFQQRPGGQTPCCGYEEETNNWGGSSNLLGERWGPVRVIRETWGADSGTNVIRRELFYGEEIRYKYFLRVHVIPPLDGIYAQWDYNAGAVSTYYNMFNPSGVAIDGKNDEVFGNSRIHLGFDGAQVDSSDKLGDALRGVTGGTPLDTGTTNEPGCKPPVVGDYYDGWDSMCIYNDVDLADPTFSGANALLSWEEIAGGNGTLVTRWWSEQVTPL